MQEAPIVKSNLPIYSYVHKDTQTEVDAKWAPLRGFILVCVNGEDEGVQCFISGSSVGFNNAANGLVEDVVEQVRVNPATPVPIVELKSDSYKHNEYGIVIFPVFNITEWATMDATVVPDTEEDPPAGDVPEEDALGASEDQQDVAKKAAESRLAKKSRGRKETTSAKDDKPAGKQRRSRRRRP